MNEIIKRAALPSNGFGVGDLWYRASQEGIGVELAWEHIKEESEVIIPEEVTYEEYTYEVTRIANCPFSNCKSLKSITIPNSITSIEDGCNSGAFNGCSSLVSIIVQNGNPVYDSRENCNAIIETKSNTLIAGCSTTIIPDSVTSIGDCAFYGCSSLISISIPNSITSIGAAAFRKCESMTAITIPNSVTSIEERAFQDCESLTSITIPDSVTNIGDLAFADCDSLTSIVVPKSVTSIGESAFYSCSKLTSITIPDTLASIEESMFMYCHLLTSISFQGTIAQWNNIILHEYWNYGVPATVVHCTDGDVEI